MMEPKWLVPYLHEEGYPKYNSCTIKAFMENNILPFKRTTYEPLKEDYNLYFFSKNKRNSLWMNRDICDMKKESCARELSKLSQMSKKEQELLLEERFNEYYCKE